MSRSMAGLMIGLVAVVLSGSSCTSHDDRNDAPPPPHMEDGQMGYQGIPPQQIQPRVQSVVPR